MRNNGEPMESTDYSSLEELHTGFQAALDEDRDLVLCSARESDPILEFAEAVCQGLSEDPPRLHCRFLYDAEGSRIYDRICGLPEYYPARTETAILAESADRIRALTGPANLLEFGSGYSVKTRHLLAAYTAGGQRLTYIPVDVSASALRSAARQITAAHSGVNVIGVNATYDEGFGLLTEASPVVGVFLGGTVGNFDRAEATAFWAGVAGHLEPGDHFLLGVDLHKDAAIVQPAYDDAAGVSACFTRNLFARMNRELGTAIDVDAIEHDAAYNQDQRQVEIHARFSRDQRIRIAALDRSFAFRAGERILTEVSRKFRLADLLPFLQDHGLRSLEVFTDPRGWFALILLRRDGSATH